MKTKEYTLHVADSDRGIMKVAVGMLKPLLAEIGYDLNIEDRPIKSQYSCGTIKKGDVLTVDAEVVLTPIRRSGKRD